MTNEDIEQSPPERSDDPRRGDMPHLKRAIEQVKKLLDAAGPCASCKTTRATRVVNVRALPVLLCATCGEKYRAMDQVERRGMLIGISMRGA
jgi:hypothetical protein